MEFIIHGNTHELRGAIIGDRRWVIASSVGRAVGLSEPKSFGKVLLKKDALNNWADSFVANGFGVDRHQDFYAIQRRVMSASLAGYIAAHGRVTSTGISTYMLLLKLHSAGFDQKISECSQSEFVGKVSEDGIIIDQ